MAITRVGGSWIHKYVSLVADDVTHTYTRAAKPELNLPNGSRCFEMDSDTEYIYDRENDAWEVYVPSSGEGSGGTTDYTQLTNKPSINNVQLIGNKSLADLGAVSDVQINGTSILSNGIANVPVAGSSQLGVVMSDADYGTEIASNRVRIVKAADNQVQAGTHICRPITPSNQDKAAFYGLAKAAGHDEKDSVLSFGTYTDEAKSAIREMLGAGTGDVDDVQIGGTSILSNGVANIPFADLTIAGAVKVNMNYGISIGGIGHELRLVIADEADIKSHTGWGTYKALGTDMAHATVFYGLARAAGADMNSIAPTTIGVYPEAQKTAIRNMLGVTDANGGMNVVTLTGTTITQTAAENTMYKCGELAELTFTAPASGITAVRFSSGSTPTVASFPGVTWLGDFDPDNLISNVTYEINIFDGVGVAGWA